MKPSLPRWRALHRLKEFQRLDPCKRRISLVARPSEPGRFIIFRFVCNPKVIKYRPQGIAVGFAQQMILPGNRNDRSHLRDIGSIRFRVEKLKVLIYPDNALRVITGNKEIGKVKSVFISDRVSLCLFPNGNAAVFILTQ